MTDTLSMTSQLSSLLSGVEKPGPVCNGEVVSCSLYLLQKVPATRQAVLEYLSLVFEEAAAFHLKIDARLQGNNPCDYEGLINQIQDELQKYIKHNPNIWTPALSKWSIDLLGQISTKLRHGGHQSPSLNEQLQQWMTCSSTKTLIQIASDCLAAMVGSTPEVCVDALLEASVKYAPHFDWVVAHIGSCFPQTVIERVLLVGLNEYHSHMSQPRPGDPTKLPKIISVVGILAHLANHHAQDLNQALITLFQASLRPNRPDMYKSVVGFLLRLSHMSPVLLQAVASNATHVLTPGVVNELCLDLRHQDGADTTTLTNLVVQLLRRCNQHAYSILQLLLNFACPALHGSDCMDTEDVVGPVAQERCALIINWLLLDHQRCVHRQGSEGGVEVPFLRGLMPHSVLLTKQLTAATGNREVWLSRLVLCVGLHSTAHDAATILSSLLLSAATPKQLDKLMGLHQELCIRYPEVFSTTLTQVIGQLKVDSLTYEDKRRIVDNLIQLVEWEKLRDRRFSGFSIIAALQSHLCELSVLLSKPYGVGAVRLLCTLGIPATINQDTATMLQRHLLTIFFSALTLHNKKEKFAVCMGCIEILQWLCVMPSCQTSIIRHLLEISVTMEYREMFGGSPPKAVVAPASVLSLSASLNRPSVRLKESCLTPTRPARLHDGIIGRGVKPPPRPQTLSQEAVDDNRQLLVDALWSCCTSSQAPTAPPGHPAPHSRPNSPSPGGSHSQSNSPKPLNISGDSRSSSPCPSGRPSPVPGENRPRRGVIPADVGRDLAVVFVELVTPDVMYNGMLWPDEDFMKATTERDLLIKKTFDQNPVLWQLLELLAHSPGALCYCSVIIRSLIATLVSHWETSRHATATASHHQLTMSRQLLSLLRQAGMLAPPLCHVGELLPYLSPYEVHLLLLAVWKYMKENPPDPRLQRKEVCDPHYTEILRYIFVSNISTIGHLYSRMFGHKM